MNFNDNYSKHIKKISQYFYKINPDPSQEIKENIEQFLRSLSRCELRTLAYILKTSKKHSADIVFPSQLNMSKSVGYHYNTINKAIAKFRELGFIATRRRFKSSSFYKISEFLLNPFTQSRISHLLPGMRIFALSLLIPSISAASHKGDLVKQGLFGNIRLLNSSAKRAEVFVPYEDPMIKFAQRIYGNNPVSPMIRQLNTHHSMNLSQYAMFKLSAFPDEAIEWASSKLQYTNNIRDPYNWIFKMCHDYCKDNDILPDWVYAGTLIVAHNMEKDTPIYGENLDKPKLTKHRRPVTPPEFKQTHAASRPIDIPKRKEWQPETKRRFGKSIAKPTLSAIQENFVSKFPVPEFLKNSSQIVE